jgi:GGDEF domain-containing protein
MQTAFDYIKSLTENDKVTPSALMLIGISKEMEEMIPEFASRLRDLFRSTDILGYTDEKKFIVFMKNCNKQLVERRSCEILSVISEFSKETEIYGNIGISLFPRDSEEISEIYKKAQLALVHSENKKRSGYTIYEEI